MSESPRPGLGHRWKEMSGAVGFLLASAAALLTIGDKLEPRVRLAAAALSGVVACIYLICRKIPDELDPGKRLPMFPPVVRRIAIPALTVSGAVLVFSPVLLVPAPNIDRLVPIDPVAGGKLQVFGHNLPTKSALAMRIGRDPVSEIYVATPEYVEVRVPEGASSGPIVVTRKRRLLPEQRVVYPVISVQSVARDVALLTEDIRENGATLTVLFSVLNTTRQRQVTVNSARLETVLVEDLGGPKYQQERIALGVYSVFNQFAHGTTLDLLAQQSIRLMDGTFTVTLPPLSSASFQFRLTSPPVQHHLKLVFIIVIDYFDDTGASHRHYSNRMFALETSDIRGIAMAQNLPLDRASVDELKRKYGAAVRNFGWDQ